MKTKTKKLLYSLFSLAVLALPVATLAQFNPQPPGTGLPVSGITDIIIEIMRWLLFLIGFLAVIAFALAGILYLTSAGEQSRIDRAKSTMLYAIVGVIVAIAGLVALRFATGLLDASPGF